MNLEKKLKNSREIGNYLRQIDKIAGVTADRYLADIGLTSAQANLMDYLNECGDLEVNQVDIQKEFGLTNPAVTNLLKRMEQKGLIEKYPSQKDRRFKRICLTENGQEILKQGQIMKGQISWELSAFNGFTDKEMKSLKMLLKKMLDNLG